MKLRLPEITHRDTNDLGDRRFARGAQASAGSRPLALCVRPLRRALVGDVRALAEDRAVVGPMRNAVSVIDESKIATHDEPAARNRGNYILRLALSADGLPGHFEQMWTRTDDEQRHELCCIPFFTYGLSLGDVITLTSDDGEYRVESKGGRRTIRIAVLDEAYAHERHEDLHSELAQLGVLTEFRGHAHGYAAVDIVDQGQADAVIDLLRPLVASGTLMWEWADPVVPD